MYIECDLIPVNRGTNSKVRGMQSHAESIKSFENHGIQQQGAR
jgi:hypothetical protein